MKKFRIILLLIGGLWLLIAFNMDTTVRTEEQFIGNIKIPSVTVHNLGQMDERRNHITISSLFIIVGVLLFLFGNSKQPNFTPLQFPQTIPTSSSEECRMKKCPACAEKIKFEAIKCRFCGERFDPVEVAKDIKSFKYDDSIENRVLCRDGACIGVVGPC